MPATAISCVTEGGIDHILAESGVEALEKYSLRLGPHCEKDVVTEVLREVADPIPCRGEFLNVLTDLDVTDISFPRPD